MELSSQGRLIKHGPVVRRQAGRTRKSVAMVLCVALCTTVTAGGAVQCDQQQHICSFSRSHFCCAELRYVLYSLFSVSGSNMTVWQENPAEPNTPRLLYEHHIRFVIITDPAVR